MKSVRIIVLFFITLLGAFTARAQQDPMYAQYMNQLLNVNPAYAGAKGVLNASMLVREQWLSWGENHPKTQTFFVHAPMKNMNMGLGGSIINDKFAELSNTALYGDYSYSIFYPNERSLSFGLKAGLTLFTGFLSNIKTMNPEVYDPAFADIPNKVLPNFGVGMYYSSPSYYLGFSVPKLISNKITERGVETTAVSREQLHLYLMGGYVFDISRILKFKPYFMVRQTMNAPVSIDLTGQFVFADILWLGGTYRIGDAIGAVLQIKATDQLSIGYAFDLSTNEINSSSHEVMLSFDFSFGRGRVRSPRYF